MYRSIGLAVLLLTGCGSDVCGPQSVGDLVELQRVERCRIVEGDLLIGAGYRDVLSLPNLVEVQGRLHASGMGVLDLPALERIGTGLSRGDLRVGEVEGGVSAPLLRTIGRGHYANEAPADAISDFGVSIDAAATTSVTLPSLESTGWLALDDVGLAPDLSSTLAFGDVTLLGEQASDLAFDPVYGDVIVSGTEGLVELELGLAIATGTVSLSNNTDLRSVVVHSEGLQALDVRNNPMLESITLVGVASLAVLAVEDSPTDFVLSAAELACAGSVRWTRNAGEQPLAECEP